MVMRRLAGTMSIPAAVFTATLVLANVGIKSLTGSVMPSLPSSISASTAALVNALVCDAIRKMVSGVILRPASLSPNRRRVRMPASVLEHESDDPGDAVIVDVFLQTRSMRSSVARIWRDRVSATAARGRQSQGQKKK